MKELVTVVVPLYRETLSAFEKTLLDHSFTVLDSFPFLFVSGEGINVTDILGLYPGSTHYTFNDRYFQDRTTLTKLLLTKGFYERFDWSEFILLYEMNTHIFRNELRYWCKQGYDFIQAAPTGYEESPPLEIRLRRFFKPAPLAESARVELEMSGLSLRRVARMQKVLQSKRKEVQRFRTSTEPIKNDSLFWEKIGSSLWPAFQVPTPIVRNQFAIYATNTFFETIPEHQPFAFTGLREGDTLPGF